MYLITKIPHLLNFFRCAVEAPPLTTQRLTKKEGICMQRQPGKQQQLVPHCNLAPLYFLLFPLLPFPASSPCSTPALRHMIASLAPIFLSKFNLLPCPSEPVSTPYALLFRPSKLKIIEMLEIIAVTTIQFILGGTNSKQSSALARYARVRGFSFMI